MKDFDEILTQLQSDLESDIPALLEAESLIDFSEYEFGPASHSDKIGLYIYMDTGNSDYNQKTFSLIVQLQLFNIDELVKAKYGKIVYKYLESYSPVNIGMVALDSISWESWPIEQDSSSFFYVMATWREELDSCDD